MIKYSVIIPYYEDNRLLRLVNTIPRDRYDIEIIIVDDCSRLVTANGLLSNTNIERNIKIITLPNNVGAGEARNLGLKKATGKWLLFADADDRFAIDAFQIFDTYIESHCDLIYFKPFAETSDGIPSDRAIAYIELCKKYRVNDERTVDELKTKFVVPWSKLYKSSFIKDNNITFDNVRFSNDVVFSVLAGLKAERIAVVNEIVYIVTESEGSLTSTLSKESYLCRLDTLFRVNELIRNNKKHSYQHHTIGYCVRSLKLGFLFFLYVVYRCIKDQSPLLDFRNVKKRLRFNRST